MNLEAEIYRLTNIIEAQEFALLHWRRAYDLAYADGAAAEREACAKLADSMAPYCDDPSAVAKAIRARGKGAS